MEETSKSINTKVVQIRADEYSFPVGYRFHPHDDELIVNYLQPRVNGKIVRQYLMHEVNIYHHDPDYLTARYKAKGDKIWYFFTPRDMFNKGKLAKRMTVNGYWKQRGASKNIENDSGKLIGVQKTFVYYRGNAPNREKTCWLMKEFEADASSQPDKRKGVMVLDYVLCSMHKDDKLDRRKSPRKQAAEAVNNNTGNINHPSNNTMTSVASYDQEQHNHIGNHEFAQQCYFPNNTDQEVSSLQNYASMSSLWSNASHNDNNDPLEQQLMAIPQSFLNPPCSIDSNDYQPLPSYDHYPPETELNVDVETYDFYSAVAPYERIHVSTNITPP